MHKYSNVTSILMCGLIYTNTVAIAQNNIHIEKIIIQGSGSSAGDNNNNTWNSRGSRPPDELPSWPSNNRSSSSKSPTYSGYAFCQITGAMGFSTGSSDPKLATFVASLQCIARGGNPQQCQNNVFYLPE